MTHDDLCLRAAGWLRDTRRCHVVLENCGTKRERPDAIGWLTPDTSILIECKVSIEDLRRDAIKISRQRPEQGMGYERWYLTPPGLAVSVQLPHGWGLIELRNDRLRRVKPSFQFFQRNTEAEQRVLFFQLAAAQRNDSRRHERFVENARRQLAYEAASPERKAVGQ